MNELRWILLGIGVLIIVGIYLHAVIKQKRNIRARVEKYPGFNHEGIASLNINPKKEKNIDISSALETFNSYIRQAKIVSTDVPKSDTSVPDEFPRHAGSEQQIMVLYIKASSVPRFYGIDILEAMNISEMEYGDMKIFHYRGPDKKHSSRALFSIANIHEPGTFDLDTMDSFVTDGLAIFMCLPAEIGGDIAFEIMLDTASNLAHQLGGELQGPDHQLLDNEGLNKMRETASQF